MTIALQLDDILLARLQAEVRSLLKDWGVSRLAQIWERSGGINEDRRALRQEIYTRAQIFEALLGELPGELWIPDEEE